MDRIIILGNGFDLAHGLKTGYDHFIQYLRDSIWLREGQEFAPVGKAVSRNINTHRMVDSQGKVDPWICAKLDLSAEQKVRLLVYPKSDSYYFKPLFNSLVRSDWADLETHYFRTIKAHMSDRKRVTAINKEFNHMNSCYMTTWRKK